MARRRYTPKLKAQVVLEVLAGDRTPGRSARRTGCHPNAVGLWKRRIVEGAPEIFAEETTVNEYERRIRDLEQLLDKREVDIALPKRSPGPERLRVKKKVALVRGARERHGLAAALRAVGLARSTWYYQTGTRGGYADSIEELRTIVGKRMVSGAARATSATSGRCALSSTIRTCRSCPSEPSLPTATRGSRPCSAKDHPLPTNVVWIAAHAMETGADLVSADRRFEHVDGIAGVRPRTERGATWPTV